jgi:hypothetical protein
VAFLPPVTVVTVMVALPAFLPVTRPLEETVAILPLLVVHLTRLSAASSGSTVAVNCRWLPTAIVAEGALRLTLDGRTGVTVTLVVSLREVLAAEKTFMVVFPVVPTDWKAMWKIIVEDLISKVGSSIKLSCEESQRSMASLSAAWVAGLTFTVTVKVRPFCTETEPVETMDRIGTVPLGSAR